MIEGVGSQTGRRAAPALIAVGLASAVSVWWWATRMPREMDAPVDGALLPSAGELRWSDVAEGTHPEDAPRRSEAHPAGAASELNSAQSGHEQGVESEEDELRSPLDPELARTRDWYGEYLRLEHGREGALGELASDVLAGEGPRAQKIALLRALHDAPATDKLRWFEHAVRTLPDVVGARGESVPSHALGLIARAAPREPASRAKLAELAFRAPKLQASLRRRSAAFYAAHCPVAELVDLRRQLYQEPDRSIAGAALAALDKRANEHAVALLLVEFAEWERPRETED
jgi:hypothetical protein